MKLPPAPAATTAHASAWVVGALLSLSLTVAPPAFAAAELEYSEGGAYQGSKIGQDQQFKAGIGKGAEKAENSKLCGDAGVAGGPGVQELLLYGSVFQLRHVKSGRFLSLVPKQGSLLEK